MIYQAKAKLLLNRKIKGPYYHCAFEGGRLAGPSLPGQFVMLRVGDGQGPLLRRPFSIHKVEGRRSKVEGQVEILYEVAGEGSKLLSQKKKGEYLDLIGPLGNGFTFHLPPSTFHPVLVAGGMGVAPLMFLAEKLNRSKVEGRRSKVKVLIGASSKSQILCEKEFKELGCEVKIATDDGSRGFKGKVTGLLKKTLPLAISHKPLAIYACGPRPMLREIARIAQEKGIPAQVSLEEHLSCGIGACFGCAVDTRDGYKRVCKDGPVFDASRILWGKERKWRGF